ncbi:Sterol 26-hydroxylase, mitochondrial [Symbiodinium microadriaticum]|uniref:Sterol 26-hydroxylase, mitochondrial n=1 Tax=Symbiodinium microadriaticum TaxID=2951 RepID=A0A1Q9F0N6_SYMMI|nr:Sterol 26-hydroxylase, mitochondrial [Symbiodinium microadriaticum]
MQQRGFEGAALPFSQIPGPKWPVLGALPTFLSFDGVKGLENYHQHMYDTYGPIVNTTMPGDDNSVLIFDPREARKVFLHEGKYPKGPTNDLWAMHYWKKKHDQEGTLMTESGEVWQKGRHDLQKDLFNHAAASSYCDLMTAASGQVIEAAERKVAEGTCDFETMLKASIGDVFTAAVLGRPCGFSWDGCSQEEIEWAQTSVDVVKGFAHLIQQPWMQLWPEAFKTYREFEATQNRSCELSRKMVRTALERYENFDGPEEQMPWVVRLHKRGVFDVEGVCRVLSHARGKKSLPPDVPYGETLVFKGSCSQLSWISSSCTKPSAIVAEDLEMDQPANSSFEGCDAVVDQMRGDRRWQHYNLMDAVQMVCGNRTCLPMPDCMDEVHQNLERYPPDSLVGRARAFCPTAPELWGRRWFKAFETVVHSLNQSRPHDTPPKDALVVHLRLGDVLEESAASVDEMLANPVPFYSGENQLETWNVYVRPLSSFNKSIPPEIVRRRHVVLVASAVHAGTRKKTPFSVEFTMEAGGMIIAGLDTTYNVLMWAMINLAQNPEAQQKLREEIYEVLGPSGNFTREKLSAMPYLKAVMRESHRLTPVLESITFRYIDSDLDLCGYSVPAGTRIDMGSAILQRDPKIVDDPWAFRPERFMAEAVQARKNDPLKSLLDHKLIEKPFSFGARMCLGARLAEMEMMILISQFIAKFRFEAEPGHIPRVHDTFIVPEKMPEVKITHV